MTLLDSNTAIDQKILFQFLEDALSKIMNCFDLSSIEAGTLVKIREILYP